MTTHKNNKNNPSSYVPSEPDEVYDERMRHRRAETPIARIYVPEYVKTPDTPTPRARSLPPQVIDDTKRTRILSAINNRDTWAKKTRSPTARRSSNLFGGGRITTQPEGFDDNAEAWVEWTSPSVRDVVREIRCPGCGSKKGYPCRNGAYTCGVQPDGSHPTTTMRPVYQSYVHRDRRVIYDYLFGEQSEQ